MFQKDYLMRQIQQMAQVIARALFHRRNDEPEEALGVIDQALQDLPGMDKFLHDDLAPDDVLAACTSEDGAFNAEMAVTVADVLREKGEILDAFGESGTVWLRYALWLYEAALKKGGSAVPWDIHSKIDRLRDEVGEG